MCHCHSTVVIPHELRACLRALQPGFPVFGFFYPNPSSHQISSHTRKIMSQVTDHSLPFASTVFPPHWPSFSENCFPLLSVWNFLVSEPPTVRWHGDTHDICDRHTDAPLRSSFKKDLVTQPQRMSGNWQPPAVYSLRSAIALQLWHFFKGEPQTMTAQENQSTYISSQWATSLWAIFMPELLAGLTENFSELYCHLRLYLPTLPSFCSLFTSHRPASQSGLLQSMPASSPLCPSQSLTTINLLLF